MQLFDPNNPNEKKKMIAAAVLGLIAIIVLGYIFLGGGSKKTPPRVVATPSPTPLRTVTNSQPPVDMSIDELATLEPIAYTPPSAAEAEGDRNIFAYYVPPPKPERPLPTPTPTPPPPLTISSLSPASVYGRTTDFSLQVVGDKFTPAVRIIIDGRVMPTRFLNAQQVATTVTADLIANPGNRRIEVKSADGTLYSNATNLIVTPPPVPNYNYVGLIGKPRFNDTAVLQDKGSKDFLNVQRGDVVGGRFRVNSISDKEVVLVDTTLKIKHTLTFTTETNSQIRTPTRRPVVSDEEP